MIRMRGHFPKTLWQRGALYSNKKSRKEISMGKSPVIKHKGKAIGLGIHHLANTQHHNHV